MKGIIYSGNKERIKGLMKSHGLKWVGTQFNAIWKGDNGEMKATFDRINGVTQSASLTYSGPDNDFIQLFTTFICHLGAEYTDSTVESELADLDALIEVEMQIWDRTHKPNVEAMRRGEPNARRPPAPERFIELALKDYNDKRLIQVQKIRERVMAEHNIHDKKPTEAMTDKEKEQQEIEDILKY